MNAQFEPTDTVEEISRESDKTGNYFIARVEGRGRNQKLALDAHGIDLKYMLSWIRGEVVECTEPEVFESLDGGYIAVSYVRFERKSGKKYRR